jgi:hypothetical protein
MNPVIKKHVGFKPQTLQVFATGTGRSAVAQSINEQRKQILERSLIQESVHRTGDDFSPFNTINS